MGRSIRSSGELTPQNTAALGVRQLFNIPRTGDLESLMIALSGSVTLSTAATSLLSDGIANIIETVELVADNGKVVIASLPFRLLVNGNFPRRKVGAVPSITQPGVTAAAHDFEIEAMLDMGFGLVRAKDAFLRENAYTDLKLALRYAPNFDGVFTGNSFAVSASSLDCVVKVNETLELADADGNASVPSVRLQRTANDITVGGASTKQQFKLTPEQGLRGITLRATTSAGVLSDSVISRVRLFSGKVVRLDLAFSTIKETTKSEYTGANLTGYGYLDLADGNGAPDKLADVLDLTTDATGGADSYIEFDTSAACTITIDQHGYVNL